MRRHKFTTSAAIIGLVLLVAMSGSFAYDNDYAQDVQSRAGGSLSTDPSPRDIITGSSINQYSAGETNSNIDDYSHMDDQLNVDVGDGTVKVLRTNQKANINDFDGYLVPLEYASPRELRGPFRTVTRKEGGDADVLQDKVKKKNYLWVSCPAWQLPYITKAMKALDEPWVKENSYGSNLIYYKGKNRDIRDVMRIVGTLYRTPDGIWDFDDANNAVVMEDQPCIQPLFLQGLEWVDIPPNVLQLEAAIYEVDSNNDLVMGIDWENWKNQLGQDLFEFIFWDYGGDWLSMRPWMDWGRMRSYNIAATTAYLDFLQSRGKAKLITKTVISPKSGTTAEVSAIDQVASFNVVSTNVVDVPTPYRDSALADSAGNVGIADLFSSVMGSAELNELLQMSDYEIVAEMYAFLKEIAQVDSEVLDGIRAELEALADAPGDVTAAGLNTITVSLEDVNGANAQMILAGWRGRTVNYAQSGKVGVQMMVRPVVGLESAEVMVGLSVSDVNGYTPAGLPIIEQRFFYSNLEVKDGQPIVLGGIKRSDTVESTSGIPFLVDIPWVGKYLFGRTTTTKRAKDIVVVLTPRFQLSCTEDVSPPEELATLMNLAKGEEDMAVPATAVGFDQWLLDKEFQW